MKIENIAEAKLSLWSLKLLLYLSNSSVDHAIDWRKALSGSRILFKYRLWERIRIAQHFLSFLASTFQIFFSRLHTCPVF